jgi:hypothetical protein
MKDFVMSDERKDILGHNHVVVGGFENRPEFLNKELYFGLRLEGSNNQYFGTSDQIREVEAEVNEILDPVTEVSRSGYMVDYPRWTFMNDKGEVVEAMADMVDLHQVLFEYGKRYVRAARFCFENLKYRKPGQDWTPFVASKASDIIMPLGEHGACSLLYVVEDEYTSLRSARKVMRQEDNFNYQQISRELFAQ